MEKIQVCPQCHKEVAPDSAFCPHCGNPVVVKKAAEAPISFCPHCGSPVEPDHQFCSSCGKRIASEETQHEQIAEPVMTAAPAWSITSLLSSKQTLIAALLFVGTFVYLLMYHHGQYDLQYDIDDYEDYNEWLTSQYTFWRNLSIVYALFPIVGFSLLYRLSANRNVRFFTITAITCAAVGMVADVINYQVLINHIDALDTYPETLAKVIHFCWIGLYLAWAYAYSVLLRDGRLSAADKPWVGILVLRNALGLAVNVCELITGGLHGIFMESIDYVNDSYGLNANELSFTDFYTSNGLYPILWQVLIVLTAFALWRLARSNAYNGIYDTTVRLRLSPVNKWMGASLLCILLVTAGLYLYYAQVLPKMFNLFI